MAYDEALMIPPMKIWELPDNKKDDLDKYLDSDDYFAQLKVDGFWFSYERTENHGYLFSRTKSAKDGLPVEKSELVPHITNFLFKVLPPKTIVIGEIYKQGGTSKDVTSVLGCLKDKALARQEKVEDKLRFYIHDIIYYNGINLMNVKAENRYKILVETVPESPFITIAKVYEQDKKDYLEAVLNVGGEGIVLKRKNDAYIPDKRPAWSTIKVKKHGDVDVVCMGLCDATKYYDGKLDLGVDYSGKDADKWDYWVVEKLTVENGEAKIEELHKVPVGRKDILKCADCRTVPVTKGYYLGWKTSLEIGAFDENGQLKKIGTVSSGLTDSIKISIAKDENYILNKVVTVHFMEKDNNELTLRHPSFDRIREDKNPEECTLKEIFTND